ncbi:5-oxoprolinase subunit PxpB [Uliginosibacterium paludis]|uniref:5-oxoprolinase subunit PxpB n=1 Tax=Uliginosibacterium paludis TaxID=1615952 RepID=A0ABV2CM05_9RHOO
MTSASNEPGARGGSTRFYLQGERCAVIHSDAPASLACQRRIWWLAEKLVAGGRFLDVVPGMNNLGVVFDPQRESADTVLADLRRLWRGASAKTPARREVHIPVEYGGEAGPDLAEAARLVGMKPARLVKAHSSAEYTVFFLGFQPGFAYMGGLPPELEMPRRTEPRLAVPAGSVGIGGEQTGIYPAQSPGGWQLIGRTSLSLFDPGREQPSLLLPGDTVRFVAERVHA